MDQDSFTPEDDQGLLLAVAKHAVEMSEKCSKALDMGYRGARTAVAKIPWYWSDKKRQGSDPVITNADEGDEEYNLNLTALLAEDYKPPVKMLSRAKLLATGLRFYADTLDTLSTPDALRRPAFYVNKCLPKLLIIDERMSDIFVRVALFYKGIHPLVTNMDRTRKTNLARRDGTDQDVLAAIEKLKASDPKDRERYTKNRLAGAIHQAQPGPLPTVQTIHNSLKRLFFTRWQAIGRGQKFSLRDLTE